MLGRAHYRASLVQAGSLTHEAVAVGRCARVPQLAKDCAEREERSYRHYMEEHGARYRTFSQLSPREQRAYWSWRLTHEEHL